MQFYPTNVYVLNKKKSEPPSFTDRYSGYAVNEAQVER